MNFRRDDTEPYDISVSTLANITRDQCLSAKQSTNVLSLTEEDKCGLTAWVKADVGNEARLSRPATSLCIIIAIRLMMHGFDVYVEWRVLHAIGPNMSFEEEEAKKFLNKWREDVTKVPTRVRAARSTSSNIWYIPFVTFGRVASYSYFYRFQSSLPL